MDAGGRAYGAGRPPPALRSGACRRRLQHFLPARLLLRRRRPADTTGSITPPPGAKEAGKLPPDGDLAYARAAASEVLRRDEKDASLPWENPQSGARGTVTPIASAYTQDGQTCRDFLASYVNGRDAVLAAGRSLQAGQGRLGSAQPQALEALLTARGRSAA